MHFHTRIAALFAAFFLLCLPFAVGQKPSSPSTAKTAESVNTLEDVAVRANSSRNAVESATDAVTPEVSAPAALQFVAVTPCRIADTRNAAGAFGGPELAAGVSRSFDIPQSNCGIPATAVAYSLNVTVVPIKSLGFLTIWPAGQAQPVVSTLNSDGRVKANATITPAGTGGAVNVYASDATQFILDIDGYFVPAGTNAAGLEFFPLTPCRIADTRNATGPLGGPFLGGDTGRAFPVQSSACGIPSTAKAYSLNVTAVPHGSLGFLTAWPSGQAQPVVSTLNSSTGTVTANAAIVPAGSGGDISIYVSDASDVILDVNGYFAAPAAGGLSLYTVTPCRALDTRSSSGAFDEVLTTIIQTSACAPSATAQAYVLNATALPVTSLSYLTLWASGGAQPDVSTLNASDGAITSNMAIVPTFNGAIEAFSTDSTQLILDLSSYFAPASAVTSVSTSCSPVTIQSGQTSQCSAVVQGTGSFSSSVSWSASTGSITSAGLYSPPTVLFAIQAVVTATSTQDTTKSGSILITVNPTPDFSISVSPSSVNTKMGTTSAPVTVSVNGLNGFTGIVSVSIPGLPSGITCSPSCPFSISANSSAQLSFVVPAKTSTGSLALTIQANSGTLSHSAPLTLDVTSSLQAYWNLWNGSTESLPQGNPAAVSGLIFVSGWAFENIPLSAVTVLVDNAAVGNAFYGSPRPDIDTAIKGAPEDCGFSLSLDTTKLSNGLHTVAVNVTDSANNVTAVLNSPNRIATLQINVNNPAPTATGPVAKLTIHAPTTSLVAGTIVGFTASATNGSGQAVSPSFTWNSSNASVVKVTPTGALLPLAAGNATISVSAGGQTQQVGVTVQAGSGTPGSIQVSIGPEETVFQYLRDACMENDYADSPAHATHLGDGSILLIAGDSPFNFADTGADFWSLQRRCSPTLVSQDNWAASSFQNLQWIFSIYNDGSTIHALVHNEYHDPVATTCNPGNSTDGNPCQYTSITYATSTDGGKTFSMAAAPQNVVAPPPAQWTPPASSSSPFFPNFYYGYQAPTNIVHASDGYYYGHFIAFPPPPASPYSGGCVMRTQTLGDPTSWRAWDGTAFELQMTDPYTGAAASICDANQAILLNDSLTFNTYLNQYMLLGLVEDYATSQCGFFFSLSSDLVDWTPEQLVASAYTPSPSNCERPGAGGTAGSFAYASIIDPDDTSTNFEKPGRTAYMYYTRFNDNTENRDLVRVPVIITKY
jgi:Bacterial Ig-like domain (group 2)